VRHVGHLPRIINYLCNAPFIETVLSPLKWIKRTLLMPNVIYEYNQSTETLQTNAQYFIRKPKHRGDVFSVTC